MEQSRVVGEAPGTSAVQEGLRPPDAAADHGGMPALVRSVIAFRPSPRALWRVAAGIVVVIAFFGVLGSFWEAHMTRLGPVSLVKFDLDEEVTWPSGWSTLLLYAAAAAALLSAIDPGRLPRRTMLAWTGLFGLLGADEFLAVHEHIEAAVGVDWQTLYLPLGVVAAVLWVVLLRSFGDRRLQIGWTLAAAAWGVAQLIEKLQWDSTGHIQLHPWTIVPEETLEMAGSALFAMTLVWERALRPAMERRRETAAQPLAMVAQPTTASPAPRNTAV